MNKTDFLFARSSFVRGMGKVLDMGATSVVINTSNSPDEADYEALQSDWEVTGDDIREAIDLYGNKIKTGY